MWHLQRALTLCRIVLATLPEAQISANNKLTKADYQRETHSHHHHPPWLFSCDILEYVLGIIGELREQALHMGGCITLT